MNKKTIKKYLTSFVCVSIVSVGIGGIYYSLPRPVAPVPVDYSLSISSSSSNLYVEYGTAGNSGDNKVSIQTPIDDMSDFYFEIIDIKTNKKIDDSIVKVKDDGQFEWTAFDKDTVPPSCVSVQLIKKNDKNQSSNKLLYSMNLSLPLNVFKWDQTDSNKLLGFTDEFLANQNEYSMCSLLSIPNNTTEVGDSAFTTSWSSTIPSFIKILKTGGELQKLGEKSFVGNNTIIYCDLSESIKMQSIAKYTFSSYESLIELKLPNASNVSFGYYVFEYSRSLSTLIFPSLFSINSSSSSSLYFADSQLQTIIFDGFNSQPSFDNWRTSSFDNIAPVGWIYSTGSYDSTALLNDLKAKFGGSFNNWEAK